jgi:XTP/dITP diphosphohydrolase
MQHTATPDRDFGSLVRIMQILRKECPWDREQTHESLKDLMVEEVYEAIDAIDRKDYDDLRKELGDMLLHVVFHAEMGSEHGGFDIGDVIFGIQDKLIRRHPHVFAETKVSGTDEVLKNWEQIKKKENPKGSVLDGVPSSLPGLLRAQRMQEKAAGVGFDWPDWKGAWVKLEEEMRELSDVLDGDDSDRKAEEFGDVMFSMVNVGRYFGINAEDSLRLTNAKFQQRFSHIEKRAAELGLELKDMTLEEMDKLWDEAKSVVGDQ